MKQRSDKISGGVTCGFGILLATFAAGGLAIVTLQRLFVSALPPMPPGPNGVSFEQIMDLSHAVWFAFLPIAILGGGVFIVAGCYLWQGSELARRVAQATAVYGYVWTVAYMMACYDVVVVLGPSILPPGFPVDLSEDAIRVVTWIAIAANTGMSFFFPTALLFLLHRPRQQLKNDHENSQDRGSNTRDGSSTLGAGYIG